MDTGISGGFSVIGVGAAGKTGDRDADDLNDSPDGLRGTVGDNGERAGEAGRLAKVLIVGGIGVLDGRGPGSMGRAGNGFGCANSCGGNPSCLPMLEPVGRDGSFNPSASSSSSIDGKALPNSDKLR